MSHVLSHPTHTASTDEVVQEWDKRDNGLLTGQYEQMKAKHAFTFRKFQSEVKTAYCITSLFMHNKLAQN